MLTVYVSLLTLLLTLHAPARSRSELDKKIQDLTDGSTKVWVLVKVDDKRLGGPRKKCPAWTFDKASNTVTQQDPECDRNQNSTSAGWHVEGAAPDIYLMIGGKRYRIHRIERVTDSDTQEMQLEDRSGNINVVSSKLYFEHYPK